MAFCTECGFKLTESAAFCPNCGHTIKTRTVPPPPAQESEISEASETDSSRVLPTVSSVYDTPEPPKFTPPPKAPPNPKLYYGSAWSAPGSNPSSPYAYGYQGVRKANLAPPANDGNSKVALIVILSVLVMLVVVTLLIVSAVNGDSSAKKPAESPRFSANLPSSGVVHNNIAGSGYLGDKSYYISFIGAETFMDVDNDPAIRVYYEFTNLYDFPQSAYYSLYFEATQDGEELGYAYSWDDVDVYYYDLLNIRPELTIQCCLQYKYSPSGGRINLTATGWDSGESGGKVSCTYIPGNFPGAPAGYVFPSYANPKWTTALDSEGYLDDEDFYVSVKEAELTEDRFGERAIRVYYEFTNNTDKPASVYNSLYIYAYQDGVSLFLSDADYELDTDKNLKTEVDSGKTITVSCVFRLRNETSQVEAEVEAGQSYNALGQTFVVKG